MGWKRGEWGGLTRAEATGHEKVKGIRYQGCRSFRGQEEEWVKGERRVDGMKNT